MMVLTLVLVCFLLVLLVGFLAKSWRRSNFFGPPGLPFFGQATQLCRWKKEDVIPLLTQWSDTYGDIFEMEILGMVYIFLTEPEVVEPVLTSSTNITKGNFEYSLFRPLFNDGLTVSDGDKWRSRRKLLTPSFHFKILESSLKGMSRHAEEFVSHLLASGGKPIELEEIIFITSLKILCETAMGVELDSEDKEQNDFIKASRICSDGIVERFFRFWLHPEFIFRMFDIGKTFFKNVEITHEFNKKVIRQRKKLLQDERNGSKNIESSKNGQRKAFLDTLLELDDSHPGLFTESDMMEEVETFMLAGHHTTASALMFAQFLLANHPDVQEKIFDEQMSILGSCEKTPTIKDLNKMIYLEMVIKETLRLYPSIPFHSRLLQEDVNIDGNRVIKAGNTAVVFIYSVNRSKKHWDNPGEFIPERFAPGIKRHPFSFIPFSAGPRNCIGQKYAMMQLKTMLSTIVRYCWLEPVTTSLDLNYSITLQPAGPVFVKFIPRKNHKSFLRI